MARSLLRESILKGGWNFNDGIVSIARKTLLVAGVVLVSAWLQAPGALAQHVPVAGSGHVAGGARPGGYVGGSAHGSGAHMGGPYVGAPAGSRAPAPRGRVYVGPRSVVLSSRGFRLRPGPIFRVRPPLFFAEPYIGVGLGFNSFGWPACGPGWDWGFACNAVPFYGFGFENYVSVQPYENFAYLSGQEEREMVWLFQKDGKVHSVTDYWFVDGKVHFGTFGEGGLKSEQVIAEDELDLRRTVDVNSRRGFRIVRRDQPWEQYLRDHPDLTPPEVQ